MPGETSRRRQEWVYSSTPGSFDLENQRLALLELDADTPRTRTGKPMSSPTKVKPSGTRSGSSSSLSPPSQVLSPTTANHKAAKSDRDSPAASSSADDHQPPPAASVHQYQTFGANPLTFDDPTIYHVRDVRPDMSDDEKKEIYNVASFPHSDLSDLIAGTPPDKDFSNTKPTNQVHANTFNTYLEPYFRPLTEEDLAFLRERVRGSTFCYVSLLTR